MKQDFAKLLTDELRVLIKMTIADCVYPVKTTNGYPYNGEHLIDKQSAKVQDALHDYINYRIEQQKDPL
jgi:hypothetical protein